MAWYAISRELRPITFGISRVVEWKEPVLPEAPGDGREEGKLEKSKNFALDIWGVNSQLKDVDVPIKLQFFEISSGKKVFEKDMKAHLLPNQSTEVILKMDVTHYDPSNIVVS